jgi:hypothetical protein|tara:strand:- start:89 stop:1303 length:1215 start_codon:yes stop_codon:yes gene_type:complete
MFNFKGFQTQDKNTHLEHLEDDIINRGSKGGDNAVNFLKSVRNMLAGNSGSKTNITVKWDGAPAIICGVNPENGKFFVGTKSVFNKTPKINYTTADIRRNHGGEVARKLTVCLAQLSRLNIKGILQGDLLYTDDLKSINIDGEKMVSFTPNTITYAVPIKSDLGRRILKAKMGIVFHTQYTGKKMDSLSASFGTVKGSSGRNVFLASASYQDTSGASTFTASELKTFDAQIRMAEGSLRKAGPVLDLMSTTSNDPLSIGYRLKSYFNYYIKNSNSGMEKVNTMQRQFRDYYENILQSEIDSRKTEKGKAPYIKAKAEGLRFIDRNKTALYFAIASHITLGNCKNTLLQKMNQIQSIGNFIRTGRGYRVTAPEGYVAVDKVAGAIKLVDRLEFSRQNFTMPKGWN